MSKPVINRLVSNNDQFVGTVLISKNELLRSGIKYLLDGYPFSVIRVASDISALDFDNTIQEPVLFIVDGNGSVEQCAKTVSHLKASYPTARVVVIANAYDLDTLRLGRSVGVDGFCLSHSSREVLVKSFELVMLGEIVLPTALLSPLLSSSEENSAMKPHDSRFETMTHTEDLRGRTLSAREAEILSHLMEGAANKVIARKLDVSEATIKVHVKAILRKIGAANRTQAAMWASTRLPNDGSSLMNRR